jgi:hypothetical protein
MQEQDQVEEIAGDSIVVNLSGVASQEPDMNGMVRTFFGLVVPPSVQCEKLLLDIAPSMLPCMIPKSPKVWKIQARLLSSCLWSNVANI